MKKFIFPVAAAAMAIAPVSATAADAQRSSQPAEEVSELGGSAVILAVLAAAAVIVGIIIAVDGDDDDEQPISV